jgi:ABC-type transport system involved in cytochrome c biogenesis permease subunit
MAALNRKAGCITMKWLRYVAVAVAVAVCLGVLFPHVVSASVEGVVEGGVSRLDYIDPGTGSIIVQVLIGAVVGGVAMMGIYRVRVKNFLLNLFKRRKDDEESDE